MPSRPLSRCLACNHDKLQLFLDLGKQPLANSFHRADETPSFYPLAVQHCKACYHVQLTEAVDPSELFSNYLYVSGTTKTLLDYFETFVVQIESKFPGKKLHVLDIACNDGSLLERFRAHGHDVMGVDPARNLLPLTAAKNIPVVCDFWNEECSVKLAQQLNQSGQRKFDVVIAMNVLAHVADPLSFLSGVRHVLAPDGIAVIQTSQSEMIRNAEFDTIYHEHHSFFNVKSFSQLAQRAGFTLSDVAKAPVHGTSYVWYITAGQQSTKDSVAQLLADESACGYFTGETYVRFAEHASRLASQVNEIVREHRAKGYVVVGYGAAAKANTFLNFARTPLDFLIDDNPMKVDLLSPGMKFAVKATEHLQQLDKPVLFLILAWNFYAEVVKRIRKQNASTTNKYFSYFPEVRLESEAGL